MLNTKKKTIIISLLLLCGVIGYWKYSSTPAPQELITTKPMQNNIDNSVLATGTIDASKSVDVGAQVSGQIKKLNVTLGQTVKQGDLIAEIDSVPQQNNLLEAEAALENFQAQLKAKLITEEKNQLQFNRQQNLYKKSATSKENLDEARVALAEAKAQVAQVQSQIKQAQISVDTAKVNLGYTKIVSPIDGIIVSVPVDEGQTVNANQTTPTIVKIAQLDTVTIKAEIAEGDIVKVKPGMDVTFTVLGDPKTIYRSKLKSIDPGPQSYSDKNTAGSSNMGTAGSSGGTAIYYYGTFDVPNPDHSLKISMTAQITIILQEAKNALTVPSSALKKNGKGEYIIKVVDDKGNITEKVVEVGINNNIQAEIINGIDKDDEIIVSQASNENKLDLSRTRRPMRM